MKKTSKTKITVCLLSLALLMLLCSVSAFASPVFTMPPLEQGKVSDEGEHTPLDPAAGTVVGDGEGIDGMIETAPDAVVDEASEAVSDMIDIGTAENKDTQAGTASSSDDMGDGGFDVSAAVVIAIIIAVTVIILLIILIPKKKN